ncbi:zinc finger protein [Wuchereria bancrofti]|uniref:Zinc finger protein n=1 Tax=Wuchereria bancrofti TaxID=6293 RepID=J9DZP0_WUCBA|nr:zinc finger protein [Wuchereria bancrofti]
MQKNFIRSEHVKSHMKAHTGEKPYNCPICGKSFTQKQHLQSHMTKSSLKFHMRNH